MAGKMDFNALRTTSGILKVLAIICVAICLGLFVRTPLSRNEHVNRLALGTFVGYMILSLGYLIGLVTGPKTRYQEMIHHGVGFVLFLVIGIIMIHEARTRVGEHNFGMATGVLSLVTAVIYAIDAFFSFKYE
jgi:heme A synthase